MRVEEFKLLSKAEQKAELARVSKTFNKRYATSGNKANNALVYERCIKENNGLESETVSRSPQSNHNKSLAQLHRADNEPILFTTCQCLELLGYSHQYVEQREDEIEEHMAPFQVLAKHLSCSIESIVYMHSAAETFARLLVDLRKRVCLTEIPSVGSDLFTSFGVEAETTNATPPGWEDTVEKNVEIIRDALLFSLATFRRTLPAPATDQAQWPQDFNEDERKELQRFIRTEMGKTNDAFDDTLSSTAIDAFCEQLRRDPTLPLENANVKVIHRIVIQLRAEKRSQEQKIQKRRKRKSDEIDNSDEEGVQLS